MGWKLQEQRLTGLTRRTFLAGGGAATLAATAGANDWPNRPVTLIVPYEPGGHTDVMARVLGDYLTRSLGQPFVVENRSGAGGAIATTYVARATPDGYTLLFGSVAQISIVPLVQKVRFDPEADFVPISILGSGVIALAASTNVPVTTVPELIAHAKANPGKLNYSSAGFGSFSHLGGAMLASRADINITHVPYKGASPAVQALAAGQVEIYIGNRAEMLAIAQSGKIRLLGVATAERVADWPDVPVIADTLVGFRLQGWQGLLAPAGTPGPIVARLEREAIAAAKAPATIERLSRLPANTVGSSSADFTATIRAERALYQDAVKAAGITPKD
jgi:tripartite-type tricarboxylate transporter receptor subunit TctC